MTCFSTMGLSFPETFDRSGHADRGREPPVLLGLVAEEAGRLARYTIVPLQHTSQFKCSWG